MFWTTYTSNVRQNFAQTYKAHVHNDTKLATVRGTKLRISSFHAVQFWITVQSSGVIGRFQHLLRTLFAPF